VIMTHSLLCLPPLVLQSCAHIRTTAYAAHQTSWPYTRKWGVGRSYAMGSITVASRYLRHRCSKFELFQILFIRGTDVILYPMILRNTVCPDFIHTRHRRHPVPYDTQQHRPRFLQNLIILYLDPRAPPRPSGPTCAQILDNHTRTSIVFACVYARHRHHSGRGARH